MWLRPWELTFAQRDALARETPKCPLIPDTCTLLTAWGNLWELPAYDSRAESSSFLSPVSLSNVYHSFMVCISPAFSPFLLYLLWFRLTLSISRTTWMPSKSHLLLLSSPLLNYEALSVLVNQHHALGSSHHVTGIATQDDTYWLCLLTFLIYHSYLARVTFLKQRSSMVTELKMASNPKSHP